MTTLWTRMHDKPLLTAVAIAGSVAWWFTSAWVARANPPSQLGSTLSASSSSRVSAPAAAQNTSSGVVVVRPAKWSAAIEPWKQYRSAQGHTILEVDAELGQQRIQSEIIRLANEHSTQPSKIDYVLLVGDSNLGRAKESPAVPTWYRTSTAMVKFGGDELLATDNPYADIDGDERPDLAIGRIPADSAEAARDYLARVMAYESQLDFGRWRRDVRVVAGVGGFGALADSVIEMTTSRFLTDRVPAWADVIMTYASPSSPYCPDPFRFSDATVAQMNAGCQFWVYVGHGHIKHLDYLQVDEELVGILGESQVPSITVGKRPPIAVFLACYTGAFDAREDCISEQLLLNAQGPVACVSATRVTGPYGLASLASGMLDECYIEHSESLGRAILKAKQRMLLPTPKLDSEEAQRDAQMQLITAIASALSPQGHDLLAERQEHVWQMNLLGDPLLRLHHPTAMELKATPRVAPGEPISINGITPHAGKLHIELSLPRDKTPKNLFIAGKFSKEEAVREKMHATYLQSNERTLLTQTIDQPSAGPFACDLTTNSDLPPGKYVVRVFLESHQTCAVGASEVIVRANRK